MRSGKESGDIACDGTEFTPIALRETGSAFRKRVARHFMSERWSCFTPPAASCAYIRILVSTKYLSLMQFEP